MSNRSDNFGGTFPTPSDGGSNYTSVGTFTNAASVCTEGSGTADSLAVLEASSTQGKVLFTNPTRGSGNAIAIVLRYVDASNYMVLYLDTQGGFGEFFKVVAGSKTHLDYTGSYTGADGDTWSLEVNGSNAYTFKHNGTTVNWFTGGGATLTDATNSSGTKHGFGRGNSAGTAKFSTFSFTDTGTPAGSFTVTPTHIPKNHSGNITLTLAGTSTTWAGGGSEFSLSGVTGVTKVGENVTGATAATVVLTTDATHTGTLTVTDLDSLTSTTLVATATLAIAPTSGLTGTTPTLTLTGTNTVWTQETAAGLFTVSGGTGSSIATPTITADTAGTAVLTVGSGAGTLTITDTSTGATASFTATDASTVYNVVVHGDSIAFGSGATGSSTRFPQRLQDHLGTTSYTVTNAGVSGREIDAASGDDMRTDLAGTSVGPGSPNLPALFSSGAAGNLLIYDGGTNDLYSAGGNVSAATCIARKAAYAAAALAAGWTLFECSITPWSDTGFNTKRNAVNASRIASWVSEGVGAYVAWGEDQQIGPDGADGGAYYNGAPHLSDAGQEVQAVMAAQAILNYVAGGVPSTDSGGQIQSRVFLGM